MCKDLCRKGLWAWQVLSLLRKEQYNQLVPFLACPLVAALIDPHYCSLSIVQKMEGEVEMKEDTIFYLEDNMEWGVWGKIIGCEFSQCN